MHTPKISVMVPVYNAENYLERCIDSIAGQTYKALDIILIDDGSSGNSRAICERYSAAGEAYPDSGFFICRQIPSLRQADIALAQNHAEKRGRAYQIYAQDIFVAP